MTSRCELRASVVNLFLFLQPGVARWQLLLPGEGLSAAPAASQCRDMETVSPELPGKPPVEVPWPASAVFRRCRIESHAGAL